MKALVLGASGATGSLVVEQLIKRNIETKMVVRNKEKLSLELLNNKLIECIEGNISEFDLNKFCTLVSDCDVVISCLGHNISFKGIFGKPRMLVTDCIKNVCDVVNKIGGKKVKLILMNTTANRNKKAEEKYSQADKFVLSIIGFLLPPQKDNVEASDYLIKKIGENNSMIEWIIVRPDTLINEKSVSKFEVHHSPLQSPVFNSGKTSRINVSHFITELAVNQELWDQWKFKMPVLYDSYNK